MKRKPLTSQGRRPATGTSTLEVAIARGCATATMITAANRGRLTAAIADELMALLEHVEDDPEIAMLAITGGGNIFCVGFDSDVNPNLVESLGVVSKPTVAIINGDARDEGLELAIAADIRIAATSANFAMSQCDRGSMPRFGGTQRLTRLVGISNALRMILGGEEIGGDDALSIALVTYLAKSPKELAARSAQLCQSILSRGPIATRFVKDAIRKGFDMTLEQGIRLEEDLYALLQTTSDRAEGVRAFLEKRKPLFKGA